MSAGERYRSRLVLFFLWFMLGLLLWRLAYLQIVLHSSYRKRAHLQHWKKIELTGRRGSIRDRHGELLALSRAAPSVWADPQELVEKGGDPRDVAWVLSRLLDLPYPLLYEKLVENRRFVWLKRKAPVKAAEAVRSRRLPGIYLISENQRSYPKVKLLAHVLGFTDIDNIGREGIERQYDRRLGGEPGFRWLEKDGRIAYRMIYSPRVLEVPPQDGHDLYLTVDYRLQQIAEEEMDALMGEWNPLGAVLIALEVNTGRIAAVANRPEFDPNYFYSADADNWQNRAIMFEYEPGSTMKPSIVSRLLEEKLVSPTTTLDCENGCWMVRGPSGRRIRVVRDFHPRHGTPDQLSVEQILIQSSNVGAAKLGLMLGVDRAFDHLVRLGYGRPTGIELPAESGGFMRPRRDWSREYSLISAAMGYELRVTPLQMVCSMSAMVNGGLLLAPQIGEKLVDSSGRVWSHFSRKVVRRVLSEGTSRQMREILARVVSEGTGERAASPHFRLGGKTGTSKKMGMWGRYSDNQYVVSFIGFGPVEDPQLCLIVVADEPRKSGFRPLGGTIPTGGQVAAPVAGRALNRMLHLLAGRGKDKLWARR